MLPPLACLLDQVMLSVQNDDKSYGVLRMEAVQGSYFSRFTPSPSAVQMEVKPVSI